MKISKTQAIHRGCPTLRIDHSACSNGTVDKNQQEFPTIWVWFFLFIFFFLKKSTYCSQRSQHGTYLMLPSLLSVVDLVRGAKILPGIHPSAAGEWSFAGWYTRNMFCWLIARI